jgi:hypothetical protein
MALLSQEIDEQENLPIHTNIFEIQHKTNQIKTAP